MSRFSLKMRTETEGGYKTGQKHVNTDERIPKRHFLDIFTTLRTL